jgi:hypothetical protein
VPHRLLARDRALAHVRARAQASSANARLRVAEVLAREGSSDAGDASDVDALWMTGARARVTLNFHPDRLLADGRTVVQALLDDGRYKNQFETGLSNGSRTAFGGGARDGWEEKLFGGAYHEPPSEAHERPKYGALDVLRHADGGSPRFGSCYVVLGRHVNERCTFTWGDSHLGPQHVGTSDAFEALAAAMVAAAASTGEVLAVRASVNELVRPRGRDPSASRSGFARGAVARALDDYIEAQVHGPIDLARDVEALVIDPAHERSKVGEGLRALGERYGFAVERHPGFVLAPHEVPSDFRGPRMPALAERIVRGERGSCSDAHATGVIDAATIGRAAASLHRDPLAWQDWATPDETLQHLKQLWHVLVRFGQPAPPQSPP